MPSWLFKLTQIAGRLWITVALYSALGFAAALAASLFAHLVPEDFPLKLGSDSVDDILTILASSMLAVATFSLTTLVTAYTSVVGATAPRAAQLLVSDGAVRSSLATFVGAFIYGIVGIIALHTGYYGAQGRVILFFVTLVVLLLVILAMVRWIGQLSSMGQIGALVDRVADVARTALRTPPQVLARRAGREPPAAANRSLVEADSVGFVRNIDVAQLEKAAAEAGVAVHVAAMPGDFVHPGSPLLWVDGDGATAERLDMMRRAVVVGDTRTFEQDPRYGFTVLGEIASKALSPGLSDQGSARDVIARTVALLGEWAADDGAEAPDCACVTVPPLPVDALLLDALEPVARQGGDNPALHHDLQAAMAALAGLGEPRLTRAATTLSALALDYARLGLLRPQDVEAAIAAAASVGDRAAR